MVTPEYSLVVSLNMPLPHDPAIALWDIYPRKMKTYVYTKICTQMLVAVLFIIAPKWKQFRSIDK